MVTHYLILFLLGTVFLEINSETISTPTVVPDEACHPTPASHDQIFIIGYGSLMNLKSKVMSSSNTGINIPVHIHGIARKWKVNNSYPGLSTTFLGVELEPGSFFNGVIFKLPSVQNLFRFDKREWGYCRQEVNISDIDFLIQKDFNTTVEADFPADGAQFWVYLPPDAKLNKWPSKRLPIVQSYVDVFLTGCIEIEESYNLTNYKDECINTTQGWEYNWVNDRLYPRRPWIYTPKAYPIDSLILKHFPHHLDKVFTETEVSYNSENSGTNIFCNYLLVMLIFVVII